MQKAGFILSLLYIPDFSVLVFKRSVLLIKSYIFQKVSIRGCSFKTVRARGIKTEIESSEKKHFFYWNCTLLTLRMYENCTKVHFCSLKNEL